MALCGLWLSLCVALCGSLWLSGVDLCDIWLSVVALCVRIGCFGWFDAFEFNFCTTRGNEIRFFVWRGLMKFDFCMVHDVGIRFCVWLDTIEINFLYGSGYCISIFLWLDAFVFDILDSLMCLKIQFLYCEVHF